MTAKVTKNCGSCGHWGRDQDLPSCLFRFPDMPFWATINNGDHGDYTTADQGKRCQTWVNRYANVEVDDR